MGKIFCTERDFLPWNQSVYRQAQITDLLSSHLNIRWLLRRSSISSISLLPRLNTDMPLCKVKTCGIYYGPFLPQELVSQMASHSSKETHWIYFSKPSPHFGKWHLHSISCLNQILKTSDWSQTLHIQSMSNSYQLKHFLSLKTSQISLPLYSLQSLLSPPPLYNVSHWAARWIPLEHKSDPFTPLLKILKWFPAIFGIKSKTLSGPCDS